MKQWLYKKASTVFFITLVIYILIWVTVAYVGVYVTYVAGPLLLLSGLVMTLTKPEDTENIK